MPINEVLRFKSINHVDRSRVGKGSGIRSQSFVSHRFKGGSRTYLLSRLSTLGVGSNRHILSGDRRKEDWDGLFNASTRASPSSSLLVFFKPSSWPQVGFPGRQKLLFYPLSDKIYSFLYGDKINYPHMPQVVSYLYWIVYGMEKKKINLLNMVTYAKLHDRDIINWSTGIAISPLSYYKDRKGGNQTR